MERSLNWIMGLLLVIDWCNIKLPVVLKRVADVAVFGWQFTTDFVWWIDK
jgi:hypothetical protein